jgi:hypothetical protein
MGPGTMSHEFPGYLCAEITLIGTGNVFRHASVEIILTALIGWINPLVLLYLLSGARNGLDRTRPFIAGAIVVCCLAMWIRLGTEHVVLLDGPLLWIAGIALLLLTPLVNRHSQPNTTKA